MSQMNIFPEEKLMGLENRLVVAKGEGVGKGSLGSAEANYYTYDK